MQTVARCSRIVISLLSGLIAAGVLSCQQPAPKVATAVVQTPLSDQASPKPRVIDQIPLPPIETPAEPPEIMPVDPPQAPQATLPPEETSPPESPPPEAPPADTPPSTEPPAEEPPAAAEPAPETEPESESTPEIASQPAPAPREVSPPSDAEIRNDYLRRFNAQVERHKQYPKQARRMGRQGRVVMMIQLDAAGQLINLQIVQSSGHLALDTAATQAVTDAAPFPPPPQPAFDAAPTFQMGLSFELR